MVVVLVAVDGKRDMSHLYFWLLERDLYLSIHLFSIRRSRRRTCVRSLVAVVVVWQW